MSVEQLLNLGLLLVAWGALAWTVTAAVPAAARARLQAQVDDLYAEVLDAQHEGSLPRHDPHVREFTESCTLIAQHPQWFGLTETIAIHRSRGRDGDHAQPPRYEGLTSDQSAHMGRCEKQLQAALARHMVWSSRVWPLLLVALAAAPIVLPRQRQSLTNDLAMDARYGAATRPFDAQSGRPLAAA